MIKIENGSYHYTNSIGIHDINLDISKGETVCIMGPNGSGKSTLLKLIVGLYPFEDGEYFFEGDKIDADFLMIIKKSAIFIAILALFSKIPTFNCLT